jgi:hypothetical protein
MAISGTTVRTYVTRLLSKLGARDRVQLVILAFESGLAGPGWPGSQPEAGTRPGTGGRPGRLP